VSGEAVSALVLGTRNSHKVREIARLLEPAGILVEPLPPGIELPPETGETFEANALPKARTAAAATGRRAFAPRGTPGPAPAIRRTWAS
jgi:XTP/dITP diphosphohydrolase